MDRKTREAKAEKAERNLRTLADLVAKVHGPCETAERLTLAALNLEAWWHASKAGYDN